MDEKIDLNEREPEFPAEKKPEPAPKLSAAEALRKYGGRSQILIGATWYFVRDGWFNYSEKMQEHLGFNRVGTVILVPFLIYSLIMAFSSYGAVRRDKPPPLPALENFKRYRLQSLIWLGIAVWFYTNSWRNPEIDELFSRCSLPVLLGFLGFSFWQWRHAANRLRQEPPPPQPAEQPAANDKP